MDTGKQALTKPQKKVGVLQKKGRTEEGKYGEPAVPGRRTCGAARLAKKWVSPGPSTLRRDDVQHR